MANKIVFKDNEWTEDSLMAMWETIETLAQNKYQLDHPPVRLEIVNYRKMLSIYSTNGLPELYNHWSFGKSFIQNEKNYEHGRVNLAYEVVINTSPSIAYLMENNTATMQTLVMAHAGIGHTNFFKNNYLFQEHTNPEQVLGFLEYAKEFISECEQKHGAARVESILDSAHALMSHGITKCHKKTSSPKKKLKQKMQRTSAQDKLFNNLFASIPIPKEATKHAERDRNLYNAKSSLEEENLLVFLSQQALDLQPWERQLLSIVAYLAQYFYPQMKTKVMNEGWASFWHYTLMNDLYDEGAIDESMYLEAIDSHTAVCASHADHSFSMNPYRLGFYMFREIKRICEHPTEEDWDLFPHLAGKDWLEELKFAAYNFQDDSFILQYLTPNLIRELDLFAIRDSDQDHYHKHYEVSEVADDEGYAAIRKSLSESYSGVHDVPSVFVRKVFKKDRKLVIAHKEQFEHKLLNKPSMKTLSHIKKLWGGEIDFELIDEKGVIEKVTLEDQPCN